MTTSVEPLARNGKLAGKIAVVTAASRGIGRAIALRLAADGASVVVNWHSNSAAAEEVVAAITEAGGTAIGVQADIGVPADVDRLFAVTLQEFGALDILVNNAGVVAVTKPTAEVSDEDIERTVAVNFTGTFLAMRHAARELRDGGRIINISTGYTRYPSPKVGIYAGTKAAVEQFAVSAAKELGSRGITVNTVLPGITDTDGISQDVRENLDGFIAMTPLGRLGQPRDIADIVAFLAGDDSRWVTGQSIVAAGGLV
ncbi:glucose 1-dehydrogenase [Allokutzneria sp. A3M-2-11 16]|uniref:glucose 1-dehydrogenase n=1 Tax=Allokutzneria sp. A3M-2-11 16 TaxID=2962043 RepID=UPI0020B6F228|nr:glucose 1-dehydrogenase [Allokutzneria sp. A3M-2-11 16]MCP3799796.1 glucose 1-dehydrogenase [Allokutzneria sp. A3M-2-11 16]